MFSCWLQLLNIVNMLVVLSVTSNPSLIHQLTSFYESMVDAAVQRFLSSFWCCCWCQHICKANSRTYWCRHLDQIKELSNIKQSVFKVVILSGWDQSILNLELSEVVLLLLVCFIISFNKAMEWKVEQARGKRCKGRQADSKNRLFM